MNNSAIAEVEYLISSIGKTPFDKALPILQEGLWKIAFHNHATGPELLQAYFDSKNSK